MLEVNATGGVVWEYSLEGRRGIVYDADRLGLPEEPDDVPGAGAFPDRTAIGPVASFVAFIESWAAFVLPPWVEFAELLTLAATGLVTIALGIDLLVYYRGSRP